MSAPEKSQPPTPSSPEAETVQFLKDVKDHAERGNVTWLKTVGKVYTALEAA